jgi:hypothetical protein
MLKLLVTTALVSALALPALANGHLGNNGQGKGNKNGWAEDPNRPDLGPVPRGLVVSGDNGRTDKGKGNGGENSEGNTPNSGGEDASGDNDDDPGR